MQTLSSKRHATDEPRDLLRVLLGSSLILTEEWEGLSDPIRDQLTNCADRKAFLRALVTHRLLTEYQADRVEAGTTFGLILGNYRVLDRLGAGGMGIVFKGEHVRMRRLVAIKVLPLALNQDDSLFQRFVGEMRAIANLHHPNIVLAIDDGRAPPNDPHQPTLHYFVMEYVPGQDLEEAVAANGPFSPVDACGLAYQVASALTEAHKHNLVHRDIKPSNIKLTPDGQAKLLDFGLVRRVDRRMTSPGTVMGTLDFLAPEQARDSLAVDIRADIYGLGGTLFWCLTGRLPFQAKGSSTEILMRRLNEQPPSVRTHKREISVELDALVARMMARDPNDRYPTPEAVMNALLGFLKSNANNHSVSFSQAKEAEQGPALRENTPGSKQSHQVLVVDDSSTVRRICSSILQGEGIPCDTVTDGLEALKAMASKAYDLVLTDWNMPGMNGVELCRKLREGPASQNLKILLFSTEVKDDEVAQVLSVGADDYLNKQFTPVQLVARVKAALRLKDAQDRADRLNQHLLVSNKHLEQSLTDRDKDLVQVRSALVLGLADLVCYRDIETISHVMRLQGYCNCLATEAANLPDFAGQINQHFIVMLEYCSPLHDIGKSALPDHILGKAGVLEADERLMMQAHTTIGAETLERAAQRHGAGLAFLRMAIDIARHHHERYDGQGYPDRLAGSAIPLAARVVAVGDVYDTLRSQKVCKPALPHAATMQLMLEESGRQLDPVLLQAFQRCAPQFERIFREMPG